MRWFQFIAAWLALGATLVASLGSHALHELTPHATACRGVDAADSSPLSMQRRLARAGCGCGHEAPQGGHAAARQAESHGRDLAGAARIEVGKLAHDEHDCGICRHLRCVSNAVSLNGVDLRPLGVAPLAAHYAAPLDDAVSVGWHSRGPPAWI